MENAAVSQGTAQRYSPSEAPNVGAWIAHAGLGIPVDGMARVIPQFRADGSPDVAEKAAGGKGVSAHSYDPFWVHDGGPCDIVAYREVLS